MTTFDIFVVGSGGGPYEDNLSSYLLKPSESSWKDGIIALEAGSGLGALNRLLTEHADVFTSSSEEVDVPKTPTAADIYSWIRCYLITHPHLDHINGLVLSAGSAKGAPKPVYGTQETLEAVAEAFSGKLWPALASWTEKPNISYLLSPDRLSTDGDYVPISEDISVRTLSISHGQREEGEPYHSSAYAIRHTHTARELFFFGDVEPDSVSASAMNLEVWRAAAPKIPHTLSAIFIECSWPSGRPDELLYGHLSPEHLVTELTVLAREVVKSRDRSRGDSSDDSAQGQPRKRRRKRDSDPELDLTGALEGLRVFITHCKDDLHGAFDEPIHEVIAGQVRALVEELSLGVEIVAVEQGMLICAYRSHLLILLQLLTDHSHINTLKQY
ncbi:cyclic-AMP phosphodiesterase [Trametes cingulata]|nr:cyclic-AMP phosphodiesterase [Trametes cingulata]